MHNLPQVRTTFLFAISNSHFVYDYPYKHGTMIWRLASLIPLFLFLFSQLSFCHDFYPRDHGEPYDGYELDLLRRDIMRSGMVEGDSLDILLVPMLAYF